MSEKNISIVKQHLEKLARIVYIMLEIVKHPLEEDYFKTQERAEKTRERRQDRFFEELVRAKLESQDVVNLRTYILPESLHNLEVRYNRFLILDAENDLRIAIRSQRAEDNPEIMPGNFIECLIADNNKKNLTRLRLNNNPDKPLSVAIVNNFPQNIISNWEQGDAFRLLYRGITGTQGFEHIGSEEVNDGEEIDILLNIIQTARINRKLTQKTAESWLNSDISVSTVPSIQTSVNVLGQRANFAKVTA